MVTGKALFRATWKLTKLVSIKAWPKIRILLVIAIAISMAEFVAIDLGFVIAADIMLYLEIVLGTWAFAILARLMPGLSTTLLLLTGRMYDFGWRAETCEREGADQLK